MAVQRRGGHRRRKVCFFCANHIDHPDYKDVDLLKRFQGLCGGNNPHAP